MLFNNALTYAFAFAASVPMVAAEYPRGPKLQLYNIGEVPSQRPKMPKRASDWMGRCGGTDIPLGGYGCGNFGAEGSVVYKCVKSKSGETWLKRSEMCPWSGYGGGRQCVRNQRKKGKKFYPLVDGKKIVCVQPTDV